MRAPANDNVKGASVRFTVDPRYVPPQKAARRMHLTAPEFTDALPKLLLAGFPAPCPITGHFDLHAMDTWMDRRAGIVQFATVAANDVGNIVSARLAALG
jgi:hypothetical protein